MLLYCVYSCFLIARICCVVVVCYCMISFCLLFAGHSFSGEPYASSSANTKLSLCVLNSCLCIYFFSFMHRTHYKEVLMTWFISNNLLLFCSMLLYQYFKHLKYIDLIWSENGRFCLVLWASEHYHHLLHVVQVFVKMNRYSILYIRWILGK